MKIVISTYTFFPHIGGVSTTISILARGFTSAGHDVTVVTLQKGATFGYEYQVVRQPGPVELFRIYLRADIIILANLSVRLFFPLLFIPRRFALQHHSESAFRLGYGLPDLFRRMICARATHLMTSEYVGKKSGFAKYLVTRPFPDTEHVTGSAVKPVEERQNALFVGRLESEKGVLWLCERWSQVKHRLGVETLRLVGPGSATAVIRKKIEAGEWSSLEIVGPLPRAETAEEMGKAAYIFVPSLWEEPFGAVALEGIAAGAIAICSDRGGLREAGSSLAFYYDPSDESTFWSAVSSARELFQEHLANPRTRTDYLERVKMHVNDFDPQQVVNAIVSEMSRPEPLIR